MKRPTMLLTSLLLDAGLQVGLSTARDAEEIRHRLKHEGLPFAAITLPILSDFLERGLESGRLAPELGRSFRFQNRRRLPQFLGGFFRRVFDDNGYLLADPDADSILAIRQVSRAYKKVFEVCDESRLAPAIQRYATTEEELKAYDGVLERPDPILDRTSQLLWHGLLNHRPAPEELHSRHGPGATMERLSVNERYTIKQWPNRFGGFFPLDVHAIPSYGHYEDLGAVDLLDEGDEPPVRVVFVPKTALTPRVIAVEPAHMQYVQQGVMAFLVKKLESDPITKGHINFTRQDINQRLARVSSKNRLFATIDLKDASDRVHKDLAQRILRYAGVWEYLDTSRTRSALLPNGTTVQLRKFASMGSATCFPVEAMVFFTLIVSAMHVHFGQVPTHESVRRFAKRVYVYGDDIIVPTYYVDIVCAYLESYGLLVNRHKTFAVSHFRESCGADYFRGQTVKPVYFRQHIPVDHTAWTPSTLLAWTSTSNQLYLAGYWKTSQLIRDWIEERVGVVPRCAVKVGKSRARLDPSVYLGSDTADDSSTTVLRHEPRSLMFSSVVFNTGLSWSARYQSLGWSYTGYKNPRVRDEVQTMSGALFKAFRNIGLDHSTDFLSSNKRGVLKPKRQWASFAAS